MTTLTVTDGKTPSQQIVDDANRTVEARDTRGRTITMRRINTSIRRRVALALTAENQLKSNYLLLATLAASVVSIDGVSVPFPVNEIQFNALIDRLDDDGFEAVGNAYKEAFGVKEGEEPKSGE